jgi:multiple sugar transport system substrate-binding protein
VQLDTPEVVEALEFYRQLVSDRYAVHHDVRRLDFFAIGRTFVQGGLVMAVAPVGFAALGEVAGESKVKGRVGVTPLPHAPDGPTLTLSSYWVLAVPAKSPNGDLACRFVKHCAGKTADKARTLAGVLGCRKSTWADAEVRKALPFAAKLEELHAMARALPQRADLSKLAAVVDRMVIEAIDGRDPLEPIVERAQKAADALPK